MRKLMWFTVGFAAACAAGVYVLHGGWLVLAALVCLPCAVALYLLRTQKARIAAVVLLGLLAGFGWVAAYDALYLSDARAFDGQTADLSLNVTDYSYDTDYGTASDGTLELAGRSYRVRFYLQTKQELAPGDRVTGSFRLRYTADGGQKKPTYHQGSGIFLLAYAADEVQVSKAPSVPAGYFAATLRVRITQLLGRIFPADTEAFVRALLLGDSSGLTYQQDTAFQLSGIRHVIAVSGLHVSMLFSLVYLISGRRRFLTVLLGLPALAIFAAIAGFTPSIVRACIMQALMLLALLINKEYDPPTSLAFAVLVMLAVNPLTVTSVSFQLSAGSVAGILAFSGRISRYLLAPGRFGRFKGKSLAARLSRWAAASVSTTVGAMVTTTPLCAYYFGTVSLVGIVTNLLTLWVISYIFIGIMLACALGAVWLPAGGAVAWLISWPVRYVLAVADGLGSLPLAAVYTESTYVTVWLVFCYMLLALFVTSPKKKPLLYLACVSFGLCAALALSYAEPRQDEYRISVLDVGQGQCILLQSDERTYMVDCGGDSSQEAADLAVRTLLCQGITRLDGIILTHYDEDHVGGALLLLSRVQVDRLYLPDAADDTGLREAFTELCPERIEWVGSDTELCFGSTSISIFTAPEAKTQNDQSLCILYQTQNCDILIMGDRSAAGERALLERIELPKLEVLVAGHHGSKTSSSLELLSATRPSVTVISVSAANTFGHPHEEVLQRLEVMESAVFRTDLDGNVIIRG